MAENITRRYMTASAVSVAASVFLSKLTSAVRGVIASDIMITGSGSAIVRMLPTAANYLSVFLISTATACAAAAVFYALTYFGRKTARTSALISWLIYFLGTALFYVYTAVTNSFSPARLLAAALTLAIDTAYFAAMLAASVIVCAAYLKRCAEKTECDVNFVVPALWVSAVMLLVHLADLTFSSVLPFVMNNTVIASDVRTIIGDYVYYTVLYGVLHFVLMLPSLMLYKHFTGTLVPKILINKAKKEL